MTKIALIDLETTGLDPAKHEIIEIACIILDSGDFSVKKTLEIKVKPENPEHGDPKAFEVNGYNSFDWQEAADLKFAMTELARITSYATMLAYNVSFDYGFLKAAFDKTGVKDTMNYQRLDLLTLAWFQLPHLELKSWKLKSVAEHLGVPPEPTIHRAMNGALCAYEVLKKLRQPV